MKGTARHGRTTPDTSSLAAIARAPRPARLPLSSPQQRLWFMHQFSGGRDTEYNLPMALRLCGPLDLHALAAAVQTIVRRHESLRTRFMWLDGEPEQVIAPAASIEIPLEDLSGCSEAHQTASLDAALEDEWSTPFDLVRGPLLRLRLFRLAPEVHVLIRTCHHIVSDALSQRLFNRELRTLYEAFRAGRPDPLRPLPVQYADFALWQRASLGDPAMGSGVEYWTRQLAGIAERLALPTDRPGKAVRSNRAGTVRTTIERDELTSLRRMCKAHRVTTYMALLAALGVLLSRHSSQRDLVVVSAASSRCDTSLDDLIGMFLNHLPMRLAIEPRMSFEAVLADVRRTTVGAYIHQYVPFERIVSALALRRTRDGSPLFQVAFAFQNAPVPQPPPPAASRLTMDVVWYALRRVRGDLEVQVRESEDRCAISWIYSHDLFDRWRIEQMSRHYSRLIACLASRPGQAVGQIDLPGPADQRGAADASAGRP